jgi:hypothetical protein
MREIVFALEFRGKAGPVPGEEGKRQARTTASSQLMSTILRADGIEAGIHVGGGDIAVLDARVQRFGDGTFVEEGMIRYGKAGAITFETIGRGWVGPGPIPGTMAGGVLWKITGGEGHFAGAQGLITSNFTVNADGDVVDDHFARVYLP